MTDLFYNHIFYSKELNSTDITTNFQKVKKFDINDSKILDNCTTLIFDENGNVDVYPHTTPFPYMNPLPNPNPIPNNDTDNIVSSTIRNNKNLIILSPKKKTLVIS